jgi:hypothetical protein
MACISYVPALQSVFNTAPLSLTDWLILFALGAVLLLAEESRKAIIRARARAGPPGLDVGSQDQDQEAACKS